MTILDEKEPTISLKLIVAVISIATTAGFAMLFAFNGMHSTPGTQHVSSDSAQTGNI